MPSCIQSLSFYYFCKMKNSRLPFIMALFISVFFTFCGTKNEDEKAIPQSSDIVSSEEMVLILEDVYLAEGAISIKEVSSDHPKYFAGHYYNYVLKKHNINSARFMESYRYYSSNADEMVKILELVINDLSQKQGLLQTVAKSDSLAPTRKVIR